MWLNGQSARVVVASFLAVSRFQPGATPLFEPHAEPFETSRFNAHLFEVGGDESGDVGEPADWMALIGQHVGNVPAPGRLPLFSSGVIHPDLDDEGVGIRFDQVFHDVLRRPGKTTSFAWTSYPLARRYGGSNSGSVSRFALSAFHPMLVGVSGGFMQGCFGFGQHVPYLLLQRSKAGVKPTEASDQPFGVRFSLIRFGVGGFRQVHQTVGPDLLVKRDGAPGRADV